MKKYYNGQYIEMTEEEIREMQQMHRKHELQERSRPLTAEEVYRMVAVQSVNTLEVDDNTALRMKEFYPEWKAGISCNIGFKVQRNGKLWKVLQPHTTQTGWEPENAVSLWTEINETHAGTEDDPIPYSGNMALENGKYYLQDGEIYLCNRDTGNPVYHALADLVGLYVQVV